MAATGGVNWPVVAAVAVGVAAAGGAAYMLLTAEPPAPSEEKEKDTKKTKKKKAEKQAKTEASPAETVELPKVTREKLASMPSAAEIMERIVQSQTNFEASHGSVTDADKELFAFIRNTEPKEWEPEQRLKVFQWLQLYMMLSAIAVNSEEAARELVSKQKQDCPMMWHFIDFTDTEKAKLSAEERHMAELHKLEIASRMQHRALLAACLAAVQEQAQEEDLPMVFTTCATLGHWTDFRRLAARFDESKGKKALQELHMAALQSSNVPDFQVLFEVAEGEADAALSDVQWKVYELRSLKTRVKGVECADEKTKADLLHMSEEWKATALDKESKLSRTGGFARMVSTEIPIPMIGPMRERSLKLKGFADVNRGQAESIRHTETYELSLQSADGRTSKWHGTYLMSQERVKDLDKAGHKKLIELQCECEMELLETDEDVLPLS